MTYDGAHTSDSYKIYINGVSQTLSYTLADENYFWFSDNPGTNTWDAISIGALYRQSISSSQHLNGQISQLAIYGGGSGTTGVLTASEVSAMHDLGPGGNIKTVTETGLVDYWTMGNLTGEGDDTASTFYSQVTAGQDLTGTSMAAPFAGHTITASGSYHSTAKSVFGGSSMFFDGTNDYLAVPKSVDFEFGTGDITVEAWVHPTQQVDSSVFFASATGGPSTNDGYVCIFTANRLRFFGLNGGSAENTVTSDPEGGKTTANKWIVTGKHYNQLAE